MPIQRELAAQLLQSVAEELETTLRTHRFCNTMLARYAGDATLVLGFEELTPRFSGLLKRSKWKDFYGGVITNARLPWFVPKRMRQLTSLEELRSKYPVFTEDYAVTTLTRYCPEMLACINDGFESMLVGAKDESAIEEIALSQVMLGRFDDAVETSLRLKEHDRKSNVRFVIAIEQYRQGLCDEAQASVGMIDRGALSGWGGAQFALGICNHVPWCPYPYPDY